MDGGVVRNARTTQVKSDEVDFRVLEFSCRDDSMLSSIGKHCKESRWRICVGADSTPIEIKVNVDKQVVRSERVSVECDGKKVFPSSGSEMSKLKENFTWRAPFRGTVKGLNKKNFFEMRPEHLGGDSWFVATLIEQRDDGLFKVNVIMPDGKGGTKEVMYPAVRNTNLREADGMKMPLSVPQRRLVLEVPKDDPMHCTLQVDEDKRITHFFARATPAPKDALKSTVKFMVDKDRTQVTGNCGHAALDHFIAGEVKSVSQESSKLKHTWRIKIGPFAEHVIEVEKKYTVLSNKVASLTIDGELLVEGMGEDIDSAPDMWEARFRFIGERVLEWEVFEHDVYGRPLNTQGVVQQKTNVSHDCRVSFAADEKDLAKARLTINNDDFDSLYQSKDADKEEKLVVSPEALRGSYDLSIPYKVSDIPLSGFASMTGSIQKAMTPKADTGGFFGFLGKCCCSQNIPDDQLPSASMAP